MIREFAYAAFASIGLVISIPAQAESGGSPDPSCDGCRLKGVAYQGFFLGDQTPPDTYCSWTPGNGSANGTCTGADPNCEPTGPCHFGAGVFTIGYTGDGTGQPRSASGPQASSATLEKAA